MLSHFLRCWDAILATSQYLKQGDMSCVTREPICIQSSGTERCKACSICTSFDVFPIHSSGASQATAENCAKLLLTANIHKQTYHKVQQNLHNVRLDPDVVLGCSMINRALPRRF